MACWRHETRAAIDHYHQEDSYDSGTKNIHRVTKSATSTKNKRDWARFSQQGTILLHLYYVYTRSRVERSNPQTDVGRRDADAS